MLKIMLYYAVKVYIPEYWSILYTYMRMKFTDATKNNQKKKIRKLQINSSYKP